MGINVNNTTVQVRFDDFEMDFEAKQLNPECVAQAVATAIGGRFAAVASSTKDKDPKKIKERIESLVAQWNEGLWSKNMGEPSWTAGDEKVLQVVAKLKEVEDVDVMRQTLTERADELGLTLVGLIRKLKATPEVQAEMGQTSITFDSI